MSPGKPLSGYQPDQTWARDILAAHIGTNEVVDIVETEPIGLFRTFIASTRNDTRIALSTPLPKPTITSERNAIGAEAAFLQWLVNINTESTHYHIDEDVDDCNARKNQQQLQQIWQMFPKFINHSSTGFPDYVPYTLVAIRAADIVISIQPPLRNSERRAINFQKASKEIRPGTVCFPVTREHRLASFTS